MENQNEKTNIVLGRITDRQKRPLANLVVQVYDRDMRSEVLLAETVTNLLICELLGIDNQIIEQIMTSKRISKPGDVKKLAELNKADWKAELTKSVNRINIAGKPIDESLIDLHASSLARKFEREFPTVAFSAQLAREKKTIFKNQVDINKFFAEHDNFDLQHTNIDLFLKDKKLITKKDEAMGEELKTMQRIFKLVPNYSKTNALLKENINSSQSIVAAGETRFVKEIAPKVGLSTKEAKDIFRKAQRISADAKEIIGLSI